MTHVTILPCGCVIALLLSALTGCGSLEKPYPQKALYTISVGTPPDQVASHSTKVLRVNVAHVARPYDGLTFVYKVGESSYMSDYYNGFFASPELILTTDLTEWLARSGLYSSVVDSDSGADSQYSMEINVTALYGDFSNASAPKAVIAAKILLIESAAPRYHVVYEHEYLDTEPITSRAPNDLIKGWERAYRRMLTDLVHDLQNPHALATDAGADHRSSNETAR